LFCRSLHIFFIFWCLKCNNQLLLLMLGIGQIHNNKLEVSLMWLQLKKAPWINLFQGAW
jgi:hypothetical protein